MDPGTALGVISLGIDIADKLLKYYATWRSYERDISEMYKSIATLNETLHLLKKVIVSAFQANTVDDEAKDLIVARVVSCTDGVLDLQAQLEKVHGKGQGSGRGEKRLFSQARRALYPFRESTILTLQETVAKLCTDLGLAIQVVQMQVVFSDISFDLLFVVCIACCDFIDGLRLSPHTAMRRRLRTYFNDDNSD